MHLRGQIKIKADSSPPPKKKTNKRDNLAKLGERQNRSDREKKWDTAMVQEDKKL